MEEGRASRKREKLWLVKPRIMYKYICDICGIEFSGDTKEGVVESAQHHLKSDHNLQKESEDITKPNLAYEKEEIESRVEEVEE